MLNGEAIDCASVGLWERRMLSGRKPMVIRSYHPDIGRGSIEHQCVNHNRAEAGIGRLSRKTIVERVLGWLDI